MTQIKYPTLAAFVMSMGLLLASGITQAEDRIETYGPDARDAFKQDATGTGQVNQPYKPSGMDTERPTDLDQNLNPGDRSQSDRLNPGVTNDDNRYNERY